MVKLYLSFITLLAVSQAHMAMINPCPRYNPHCTTKPKQLPQGENWDYTETAPIGTHGKIDQPMCKYTKPWPEPVAHWTAGQTVDVEFKGSATHNGGPCQFSISYDGGKTFVVLKEITGSCWGTDLSQRKFSIQLPKNLPSSKNAIFAWSWNNKTGNREFYMNCADITISGGTSKTFKGKQMTIANYGPDSLEFAEGNTDGKALYSKAKDITVSGDGSTGEGEDGKGDGEGGSSGNGSAGGNKFNNADHLYNYVYAGNSNNKQGDDCQSGSMQCTKSGGFQICDHGAWTKPRSCAPGTQCKSNNPYIICVGSGNYNSNQ